MSRNLQDRRLNRLVAYAAVSRTGGARFSFHGFRNCFIAVAEFDLLLPLSLTKRLVNHDAHYCAAVCPGPVAGGGLPGVVVGADHRSVRVSHRSGRRRPKR